VQLSLEECVADFAKVVRVIRLMTSTASQLVVTLTGLLALRVAIVSDIAIFVLKRDVKLQLTLRVAWLLSMYCVSVRVLNLGRKN